MKFPDTPVPTPAQRRALEVLEARGPGAYINADWAPYPTRAVLHREHWTTDVSGQITRRGRWIIGRPDPRDRTDYEETRTHVC